MIEGRYKNSVLILFIQIILILGYGSYGLLYDYSLEETQKYFVLGSFIIALFSCILIFKNRFNFGLKNNFNVTTIYLFFYIIINYQFALEVFFNPRIDPHDYFYKPNQISEIIFFSTVALLMYNFGGILGFYKKIENNNFTQHRPLYKTNVILKIVLITFLLFVVNINSAFVQGGHGTVDADPLAISLYGYFIRFSIIYIGIIVYNNWDEKNINFRNYCKMYSSYFLISICISVVLFLFAHNRVFISFIIVPFFFGFFLLRRPKITLIKFGITIFILLFFSTFFKFFGIDKIFEGIFSENYSQLNFVAFQSFSPFTAEIGGSIYSGSILHSYWSDGGFIYGKTFLVGILRAFPGAMAILSGPFGLIPSTYDSAQIATDISLMNYGVGTMSNFDLLINFGFLLSVFSMFLIGYYSSMIEKMVLLGKYPSIKPIIIFLIMCSFVLFVPRGSFNDIIGSIIFTVFMFNIFKLTKSI